MTILYRLAVALFVFKPLNPCQLFELVIELKLNRLSYVRFRCHMQATNYATRIATTRSRRGKVLIFKPKASSFYTTEFSYVNFIP